MQLVIASCTSESHSHTGFSPARAAFSALIYVRLNELFTKFSFPSLPLQDVRKEGFEPSAHLSRFDCIAKLQSYSRLSVAPTYGLSSSGAGLFPAVMVGLFRASFADGFCGRKQFALRYTSNLGDNFLVDRSYSMATF